MSDLLPGRTVNLIVTGTNWTAARAVGYVYKSENGIWRLAFNISGTTSSGAASLNLFITGVLFRNVSNFSQATSLSCSNMDQSFVDPNTNKVVGVSTGTSTAWRFSGDCELDGEPNI